MKCPKCGNEIQEGKLLCGVCGEEVKMVPDFDLEVETQMTETLSNIVKNFIFEDSVEEQINESEQEIENSWQEVFPEKRMIRRFSPKRLSILLIGGLLFICLMSYIVTQIVQASIKNSFTYQFDRATECASNNQYDEAVAYLERALALEPEQLEARFLLAKYYYKNGQVQSAILDLHEMLKLDSDKKQEIYELLISIYEEQQDYKKIGELLSSCEVEAIVAAYIDYAALIPEFNIQEGVYDETLHITLESNTQGFIYYTLDGSTPTRNSMVYEDSIILESGDYTIKAYFVNMYGVESEIVTKTYYINLSVPDAPDIALDSGIYKEPQLIEIFHDKDTKVFYTLDGSVPTKESMRYTEPIEMPYGTSNLSIVAINEAGLSSEVLRRTYQLYVDTVFSDALAMQILKNNLLVNGVISDIEGHIENKLGINVYTIQTVVEIEDALYYIISEEYVDTLGKKHGANDIYAVDANTGSLFKARKLAEGRYYLTAYE